MQKIKLQPREDEIQNIFNNAFDKSNTPWGTKGFRHLRAEGAKGLTGINMGAQLKRLEKLLNSDSGLKPNADIEDLQKHLDRFDAKIGIEKTDQDHINEPNVFRGNLSHKAGDRRKELDVSFSDMKFEG